MSTSNVELQLVRSATEETHALIRELDVELSTSYAPEQRHGLTLEAILQAHIRFFLAWRTGEAVGCGGVALMDEFAEIKRMYVRPASRGTGVADAILSRLIREARQAGIKLVRLETGVHQAAALHFYERAGFTRCPAFEPYTDLPPASIATSVFMELRV